MQIDINETNQSKYCIFLYKNGKLEYVKEKNVKRFFDVKKVSYVLIPLISNDGIGFLPITGQYFISSIKSCKITYRLMVTSVQSDYEEVYDFEKITIKPKSIIEFYNYLYSLKRLSAFNYIINWEAHDEYDILDFKEFSLSLKKGDNENVDLEYQSNGSYLSESIEDKPTVDYIIKKLESKHILSVPDFYNVTVLNPQIFLLEKGSGWGWKMSPYAQAENDQLFGVQSNLTDAIYFIDKYNYGLMKAYTSYGAELHTMIINVGNENRSLSFDPDMLSLSDLFDYKKVWFYSNFSMEKPHELIDVVSNINYFKMSLSLLFNRNISGLYKKNRVVIRFLLPDNFLGAEYEYKPSDTSHQINQFLYELNHFKDRVDQIQYSFWEDKNEKVL